MPRRLLVNGSPGGLSHGLSSVDAAFLYLERKEIPLHIAAVCVFDGVVPFREFVANIESKLDLLPRYRQIPVPSPWHLGHPTWEPAPRFDIHHHIFQARVAPPGGQRQLEALVGRILTPVMDRSKPLWDIHVVDGLQQDRGALIVRIHHSLADGIAGMELMKLMLDPTPEVPRAIRKPRYRPPQKTPAPSLTQAATGAIYGSVENLINAEACLLGMADALLSGRMQQGLQGLVGLLPELAKPVGRLPFNKPCTGDRIFCWAEFDFAGVKAIRTSLGGTVNDVILTVLTRAIARYVTLHGESVRGRSLRVVCPVNVRRENQRDSLGNRITFLPVVLPLDVQDPRRNLDAVATRMQIMKSAGAADLITLLESWIGAAPPVLQAAFWSALPQIPLPVPLLNIICTNVPGSPTPLYSMGRRMLALYPHVPTGYELGVNCAAHSYDGRLSYGLTADAHVVPDVARLRDFLEVSFAELCRAAGITKKTRNRRKAVAEVESPAPTAAPWAMDAQAGT